MKLTPAQQRALSKLTGEWQDKLTIESSDKTLMALCYLGLAEFKAPMWKGNPYEYRLKQRPPMDETNYG